MQSKTLKTELFYWEDGITMSSLVKVKLPLTTVKFFVTSIGIDGSYLYPQYFDVKEFSNIDEARQFFESEKAKAEKSFRERQNESSASYSQDSKGCEE